MISAITVDSETATATETATEASVTVLSCHIYSQGNKKRGNKIRELLSPVWGTLTFVSFCFLFIFSTKINKRFVQFPIGSL